MFAVFVIAILIIFLMVSLKYPPIALILFLTAGLVKGALVLRFNIFGVVDYTVLCAILVLVAMAYSFIRSGVPLRDILSIPLVIYLLLAALLLVGLAYTSAPRYGLQKSSRFATLGLIAFLAPIVFARSLRDIKLIIWILLVAGVTIALGTIIAPQASVVRTYETARGALLEANPVDTAAKIGTALIIAFCFAIMAHTSRRMRIVSVAAICIMMVGMIFTQSRAPFMGLVFTLLAAMFICRRGVSKGWQPFIVVAIVIATVIAFVALPWGITARITRLWERDPYYRSGATLSRTELFSWTINHFPERPILGHGTGGWAVDRGYGDIRANPHNIILELLYELGLIGGLLIILFLWFIFRRWRQASKLTYLCEPYMQMETFQLLHIAGLLFLFNLLQAMSAWGIHENRLMFFGAGLVLAVFNCIRHAIEQVYVEGAGEYWLR